jgi:hypothetical protein
MNRLHGLHHLHRHLGPLCSRPPWAQSGLTNPGLRRSLPGTGAQRSAQARLPRADPAGAEPGVRGRGPPSSTWETPAPFRAGVALGRRAVAGVGQGIRKGQRGRWEAASGGRGLWVAPWRRGSRLLSVGAHFARPPWRALRGLHASGTALWGDIAADTGLLSQGDALLKVGPKTVKPLFYYYFYFQVTAPESRTTAPGPLPVADRRLLTSALVTSAGDAPRLALGSSRGLGLSSPGWGTWKF